MKPVGLLSLLLLCLFLGSSAVADQRQTENVILIIITLDGVRSQEFFSGLDLGILKSVVKEGKVEDRPAYRKYWAATPQARREKHRSRKRRWPRDWKDHGKDVEGAQYIWLAIVSPDSAKRGEQANVGTVYQNQIAATLCRFLGVDYSEHNANAGKPVE